MRPSKPRCAAVAALILLSSCVLPKLSIDPDAGDHASSSGGGGGATQSSSTSSAASSASSSSSSGVGGGDAGVPLAFQATCSGVVACPGLDPCADWAYSVADDGVKSHATVDIKLAAGEQCGAATDGPPAPAPGAPSDVVALPCGSGTWSFSIDRGTYVVYITHDPKTGDPLLSWTPACK